MPTGGAGLAAVIFDVDGTLVDEAAVVIDGFGTATRPAMVRHDPDGVISGGLLDLAALQRIVAGPR